MDQSSVGFVKPMLTDDYGIPTDSHPEWKRVWDLVHLRRNGTQEEQMYLFSTILNITSAEFRRCGIHNIIPENIVQYAISIVRNREHFSLSCIREHVEHVLENLGVVVHEDPAIVELASAYANAHLGVSSQQQEFAQ